MVNSSDSPFSFLTALDGSRPLERKILCRTRESELDVASHMIAASKVSLLYAYSGNGKSSFINAGVIPFFVTRGYAVFRTRPRPPLETESPIQALKQCILSDCFLPEIGTEEFALVQDVKKRLAAASDTASVELVTLLTKVEPYLQARSTAEERREAFRRMVARHLEMDLRHFVHEVQAVLGAVTPILVICDQFEELFVHYSNTKEMEEFVRAIGEICRDETLRCQFVFSMREDWVGSMIEFRKEIPDIFGGYFKLAPLRRSCAAPALTLPLAEGRIPFEDGLIDRVLSDLSNIYDQQQLQEFAAVKLMRSNPKDPYLELPALQVIAEALWRTRGQVSKPFTLAHYEWLGSRRLRAPDESPAVHVLSDYVRDFLEMPAPAATEKIDLEDARLDLLYLLTDRRAHRRALTLDELEHRAEELRPKALTLPALGREQIAAILAPLVDGRLLRRERARDGMQYELAHDFAVREVVRLWGELKTSRTNQIAFLEKVEKEINRRRLAALFNQEAIVRGLLLASNFILLALLLAGLLPFSSSVISGVMTKAAVMLVATSVGVAVLGLAAHLRGFTVLGILCLLTYPWWRGTVDYSELYQEFSRNSAQSITAGISAHLVFAALLSCLSLACGLRLTGLMISTRRERTKKGFYAASEEMFEMTSAMGFVAIWLYAIVLTPLSKVQIIGPGTLWWLSLAAGTGAAYLGGVNVLLSRAQRTPGTWLTGFTWGKPDRAEGRSKGAIAWPAIAFLLGLMNIVLPLIGLAVCALASLLRSRSLSESLMGRPLVPDPVWTTLEKPDVPVQAAR